MLGWRMLPYLGTLSGLISRAANHGVSPRAPPLTKHPKTVLSFPLPVTNSSTCVASFFKNYYCSKYYFFIKERIKQTSLAVLRIQTRVIKPG